VTTLREDSIGIYKEWLDAQFYIKKKYYFVFEKLKWKRLKLKVRQNLRAFLY
jgi:hypothetical protein